jgi:hypothetical protein
MSKVRPMSKKRGKGGVFLFLSCTLLLGLVSGAPKTDLISAEKDAYIEVHGPSIAYVPLSAKYVTYDGMVRKVSRFSATLLTGEEDCQCPKCCNGRCYVIVYTDFIFPGGFKRIPFFIWLEC